MHHRYTAKKQTEYINQNTQRCRNLMSGVLMQSIKDLKISPNNDQYTSKHLAELKRRESAKHWFYSKKSNYIFSFRNICTQLNISASNLIAILKAANWNVKVPNMYFESEGVLNHKLIIIV